MPDYSPYNPYITFLTSKYGDTYPGAYDQVRDYGADYGFSQQLNQDIFSHPGSYGLFNNDYNPWVNPTGSTNPYFTLQIRDLARKAAQELGLPPGSANEAALKAAQEYWQTSGQPYGDGTSPTVVLDSIYKNLAQMAGKPYQGLTPEEITHQNQLAADFQTNVKAYHSDVQDAEDLQSGLDIASVFAGPIAGGLFGGGAAAGASVADAAGAGATAGGADAAGAGAAASASGAGAGAGQDFLLGDAADDFVGANPYTDAGVGVNPGNTVLDPSTAAYDLGPAAAGSVPNAAANTAALDALTGGGGIGGGTAAGSGLGAGTGLGTLGTGLAVGGGAAAGSNLLSGSGDDQLTGGGGGDAAGGLLGSLLGGGAGGINLGQLLGAGLGFAGSYEQTQMLKDLYEKQLAMGAPYRDKLAQSYNDPMAYLTSPAVTGAVQLGTDALAKSLSVKGNPFGNGSSLQSLQDYATKQQLDRLDAERKNLANFGGLSSFNAAAPNTAGAAINASGGMYNAAGYGAGALFPQQNPMQSMYKQLGLA